MSADDEHKPAAPRRFNMEDARARASQALHKSEFILSRAYGLFRDPKKEWGQIRDEVTTIPNILIGYVAPLAAIPPVADLIGSAVFNRLLTVAPGDALIRAVVTWLVSIACVGFLGVLINAVADNFDAEKDELSAQKVAAYALTPTFLSGVFSLWPPLWWVSLFALATTVFLMFRGLPVLMKAPEDRALPYAATVAVAGAVALIVLLALASCVT